MFEDEARDVLEKAVAIFEDAKVDYGDIRFDCSQSTNVSKDKSEEKVSYRTIEGFHLRVLRRGEWRATSLAGVDMAEVVKESRKLCYFAPAAGGGAKYEPLEPWIMDKEVRAKRRFSDVGLEEKIEYVRDAFKELMIDRRIVNSASRYGEVSSRKLFMNTEGSHLFVKVPAVRLAFVSYAKTGKNIQVDWNIWGKVGVGYDFVEGVDVAKVCVETSKGALALLDAEEPPSGRYPAVLDPDMAGLIAHESFGHGLEADQVLRNRSFLSDKLSRQVASEDVTIVDDSTYREAYGTYAFDDEGVKSRKNVLVEKGFLKGFLHSRETSSLLDATPTSNGRAEDFSHKIYVRMSNTYFEKGDWSLEEMLEGVKKGVYLTKSSHGMEDPLGGGIQATSVKGCLIESGEMTKLLRPVSLSGNVLSLLNNVDAVGKDFRLHSGGCGKGYEDWVRVSSGGPSIRVKEAILGGG